MRLCEQEQVQNSGHSELRSWSSPWAWQLKVRIGLDVGGVTWVQNMNSKGKYRNLIWGIPRHSGFMWASRGQSYKRELLLLVLLLLLLLLLLLVLLLLLLLLLLCTPAHRLNKHPGWQPTARGPKGRNTSSTRRTNNSSN